MCPNTCTNYVLYIYAYFTAWPKILAGLIYCGLQKNNYFADLMFASKRGRLRAFVGRLVTSGISPPFLRQWFSSAKYCFFKRRAVDSGTVKCRDAFIGPCSAPYCPIVERSSGIWRSFFFPRLGSGPASSVSLVRLATHLLASTRPSFGNDGVDPDKG